jgi:hypothetical protein
MAVWSTQSPLPSAKAASLDQSCLLFRVLKLIHLSRNYAVEENFLFGSGPSWDSLRKLIDNELESDPS